MKKILKILGIFLLVIVVLLVTAPIVFESQLKDLVKKAINNNVNAKVEFADLDLSLFRSFPQATLVLEDLSIVNNAPFEGDTLAKSDEVVLEMSVKELFKAQDEPKKIDELKLNNAFLDIRIDSLGNANYDIAKEDTTSTQGSGSAFRLDLKHYEINNSRVKYLDQGANIALDIEDLNHSGTGDFSLDQSELDTKTNALVSLDYDGTNYLNKNKVALDAIIQMDLENQKYTFLENEATINQLPLTFNGYVKVNEDNNELDLSFKTPSSDFKNFLAVIPATYAKNIENVETQGNFVVDGRISGIVDENRIPEMDISVSSDNASFKYPDLPKSVQDINIDLKVLNESGIPEDTYVTFKDLSFRIDQDRFTANGSLRNLTENMLVNMELKGTVNLANISKAYPLELKQDLNGILTADVTTSFDMNSIEKEQYQNVNSKGTASIRNFSYKSPEIPNEIRVSNANLNFNQGNVRVPELKLTTGKSDITASGNIHNLMGFLFTDQQLKGNFQVNSNTFSINDFMVARTSGEKKEAGKTTTTSAEKAVKIPSFLDTEVNFRVNKVLYDDLVLNNASGKIILRDETATLQNVSTDIFDGNIGLDGNVSTKNEIPTFQMDLQLNALNISQSFNGLDLLQGLAPIANALDGKLQTSLQLKGNLNNDFTPDLRTIAGEALARILTADLDPAKTPLLGQLDQQLGFLNLKDIDLNKLKTHLTFEDGTVKIDPFDFDVKGINVEVSGGHSFDMSMNYNLSLDVPAKYLGNEVGSALGKLSGEELENMRVELPIGLTGSFQNPNIRINMKQAVNSLTQRIVEKQKQELVKKGTDVLTGVIKERTGGRSKPDTTATKTGKDTSAVKTPEPKDSVSTPTSKEKKLEETAKDILGGILKSSKKKKDTTQNQ
ncbi:AsmA-like C-terminal region-containing protein [Salegentibacter chungangensis]|uniref:AsmA-like C-terminal region-containing protein n=1 Tax=Salegentibacter chungangensis TaxID=1335724 RepID=A0ABW3NRK6_9FLAO